MKIISRDKIIYHFSARMEPVESVLPDQMITFETHDCFERQIDSEQKLCTQIDFSRINPATGPVYVEGAEKGDLLSIKILDIALPDKGIAVTVPGEGVLADIARQAITRIIEIKDGYCYFKELRIPVRPMVGVIGVAPLEGKMPTGTPWAHGGNMDTTDIAEGAVVYLPVAQPGALLALGDCHAVMGDGEVCVAGCEINSEVTVKVGVIKNAATPWPLVETKTHTMIIASGDDAQQAIYAATQNAVAMLQSALNLSWEEAYILASLAVDLKISQMVDPKKTVRAAIPKWIASTRKLLAITS